MVSGAWPPFTSWGTPLRSLRGGRVLRQRRAHIPPNPDRGQAMQALTWRPGAQDPEHRDLYRLQDVHQDQGGRDLSIRQNLKMKNVDMTIEDMRPLFLRRRGWHRFRVSVRLPVGHSKRYPCQATHFANSYLITLTWPSQYGFRPSGHSHAASP